MKDLILKKKGYQFSFQEKNNGEITLFEILKMSPNENNIFYVFAIFSIFCGIFVHFFLSFSYTFLAVTFFSSFFLKFIWDFFSLKSERIIVFSSQNKKGIQIEKEYFSFIRKKSMEFFGLDDIDQILLNEGLRMNQYIYYIMIISRNSKITSKETQRISKGRIVLPFDTFFPRYRYAIYVLQTIRYKLGISKDSPYLNQEVLQELTSIVN